MFGGYKFLRFGGYKSLRLKVGFLTFTAELQILTFEVSFLMFGGYKFLRFLGLQILTFESWISYV